MNYVTLCSSVLVWCSQNIDAYNNLGVLYKESGNLERSIECFQQALHYYPNYTHGMNNIGMLYGMIGKDTEARIMYQKALETDPNFAVALNNLGVLLRDQVVRTQLVCCHVCP